ncbi:DMT family transporter [Pelagibius sp. Alg239-R121]|uniref:DMT family transporter n=1 Tax=Pelagibius sp. Alg239-R121 TaxID=2993448 RepID=UPI0024A68A35|nr:DMT family transporter [Pelagibius sp. Alg239-R121]
MLVHAKALGRSLYDRPYLLLSLTMLFWGGNTVAGQLAVGEISPLTLTFIRWLLVSAFLWAVSGRQVVAEWPVLRPRMLWITGTVICGFTGFNSLFYIASHQTTAVNIGIIQGAIPVVVLIGAFFLYRTRVGLLQAVGAAVTIFGVIVVATSGDFARLTTLAFNPGDVTMMIACLFYSVYTVRLPNRPKIPGLVFFTVMSLVAAVTTLPLMLYEVFAGDVIWPSLKAWAVLLYVALFPSFIAQVFFMRGVELIGPGRAGIFVNLVPVFGAGLAVLILGESFHLYHAAALILVLGGIWLSERHKVR